MRPASSARYAVQFLGKENAVHILEELLKAIDIEAEIDASMAIQTADESGRVKIPGHLFGSHGVLVSDKDRAEIVDSYKRQYKSNLVRFLIATARTEFKN
jgi:hypothetical protein